MSTNVVVTLRREQRVGIAASHSAVITAERDDYICVMTALGDDDICVMTTFA